MPEQKVCLLPAYSFFEDVDGCFMTCHGIGLPNAYPRSVLLTMHWSTDTAQEIVAGLGEIAGAARAEGLREILEISEGGGGQKKGQILYDFMAQGTYIFGPLISPFVLFYASLNRSTSICARHGLQL